MLRTSIQATRAANSSSPRLKRPDHWTGSLLLLPLRMPIRSGQRPLRDSLKTAVLPRLALLLTLACTLGAGDAWAAGTAMFDVGTNTGQKPQSKIWHNSSQ